MRGFGLQIVANVEEEASGLNCKKPIGRKKD